MTTLIHALGIHLYTDSEKEENTYSLGSDNYIPISLFLSLMSNYKQSPLRILNMYASTYTIKEAKLNILNILNDSTKEMLKDLFDKDYIEDYSFLSRKPLVLTADYKEMQLHNYVDMWNIYLNMATPKYDTNSEYTVLECSQDFIRFRNRPEFLQPHDAVKNTLLHILNEVSNIMKKRGFEMSPDGYHFYIKGFEPLKITEYYGF